MKVGVLILYFNTPGLVDELTKTLPEAIIIDNGSDIDKQYHGKNRCIRLDKPYGFTGGWNKAVKLLWDEFDAFWLMNSDIVITRKSLENSIMAIKNADVDIYTPSYNAWIKDSQNLKTNDMRQVNVIEFTAPIIKKHVFEKAGFWDELFARGYGVEFDYCYRARLQGFKIWVDDSTEFIHKGQGTISKHEGIVEYSSKANFELNHNMLKKYGSDWRGVVFKNINVKSDFNMNIVVYTTIYGDYASLKPVPFQTIKADYICITDNKDLKCQGWKTIVPDFPRKDMHPRLRAKYFKLYPWELPEIAKNDISIFIDGSIEIKTNTFIEYCIKHLSEDLLLFKHPQRTCIYQEVEASRPLEKYKQENLAGQAAFYSKFHPKNWGLWACGVMVRKHTDKLKKLMADWKHEIDKWTYQDQISFPVVCKLNNFIPAVFPDSQYNNQHFNIIWHDDNKPEPGTESNKLSITVLMPVYKTPIDLLKMAVDSILKQTHNDFEFLIVDDGNDDAELYSVLYDYSQKDKRIKLLSVQHVSISHALNKGLENASGELIIRMDSDDYAYPDLIKKQLEFFRRHKTAAICGVQVEISKGGKITGKSTHNEVIDRNIAKSKSNCWFINHPGVAFKRDLALKLGGYPEVYNKKAEDYPLWCQFLLEGYHVFNLPDILIRYTMLEGSNGSNMRNSRENIEWLQEWRKKL